MENIKISEKDKKNLLKLSDDFEYFFYVAEREDPPSDDQWAFDDLSEMAECCRKIVNIIKPKLENLSIKQRPKEKL